MSGISDVDGTEAIAGPVVADEGIGSVVYDNLHLEARRVLERNPEPRNARDVAVALESMGHNASSARDLGFDSVFALARKVLDLAYLYWVPRGEIRIEPAPSWTSSLRDFLAGSWYGLPWITSVLALFVARVALWSSLNADPQVATMVSLAFLSAAPLAGACSQALARKGTFYYLQRNFPLVRWVMVRFAWLGTATAAFVVASAYRLYVVPRYGATLGRVYLEFAAAIFAYLLAAAPMYMLRRFATLAVASGLAIGLGVLVAELGAKGPTATVRAGSIALSVGVAACVLAAASLYSVQQVVPVGDRAERHGVKAPELHVVLWQSGPYVIYGVAYFSLILIDRFVVGLAYGDSLGAGRYVYPSTYEGSLDVALLELVLLLGFVHSSMERFARRLEPLLRSVALEHWRQARLTLVKEWRRSVTTLVVAAGLTAAAFPTLILAVLPGSLTGAIRSPGGMTDLYLASAAYAMVPVGMLCSQYLFFLGRPRMPALGAGLGAMTNAVISAVASANGQVASGVWGLLAGVTVYTSTVLLASYAALARGEESFYASF